MGVSTGSNDEDLLNGVNGNGEGLSGWWEGGFIPQVACEQFSWFNTCYHDTGLFGIYGWCDPSVIRSTFEELMFGMCRLWHSITDEEINLWKRNLKHMMIVSMDGTTWLWEDIGRQLLVYGRRISKREMDARIDAIDREEVMRVARKYIHNRPLALTALGPIHDMPSFDEIKALNRMAPAS